MKKQIREIEKKILAFINTESDDVGFKRLKEDEIERLQIQIGKLEIAGKPWKKVYLRHFQSLFGSDNEGQILDALDALAKSGRVKIFELGTLPQMDFRDVVFCCELGVVKRDVSSHDDCFSVIRFYCDTPLKKSERDEYTILNVGERVRRIEQERDELFSQRYGQTNPEIEKELLLAELKAKSDRSQHLRKIANWIDEKRTLQ